MSVPLPGMNFQYHSATVSYRFEFRLGAEVQGMHMNLIDFTDAARAMDDKDYELALRIVQRSLQLDPRDTEAAFLAAKINLTRGSRSGADEIALALATEWKTLTSSEYVRLGDLFHELGRKPEGLDAYYRALESEPFNEEALKRLLPSGVFDKLKKNRELESEITSIRKSLAEVDRRSQLLDQAFGSGLVPGRVLKQSREFAAELAGKWDFTKTVLTVVTFLFGAGTLVQLYKAFEFQELEKRARTTVDSVVLLRRRAFEERVLQSEIMREVLSAMGYIQASNRERQRDLPKYALTEAQNAIEALQRAQAKSSELRKIIEQNIESVPDLVSDEDFNQEQFPSAKKIRSTWAEKLSLNSAITQMLIPAHYAKCLASFDMKDWGSVGDSAEILVRLAPERWEGYHFRGLALSENKTKQDLKGALRAFETALQKPKAYSLDWVNAAEVALARQDFESVLVYCGKFYSAEGKNPHSNLKAIAEMYIAVARYILYGDEDRLKNVEGIVKKEVDSKSFNNISYSTDGIRDIIALLRKDSNAGDSDQVKRKRSSAQRLEDMINSIEEAQGAK